MDDVAATPASEDLSRRLREVETPELLALVREHAAELSPELVRQALRNPFATDEVLEEVAANPRLRNSYEVRRAVATHPRTPQVLALRFIPGLYWRDLVELGVDLRVRPPVRRSAERYLVERLPSLAIGERMAIARRASHGVLHHLRNDPSLHVIRALLENPRLTEAILLPLVSRQAARPQVLELIADNPRWGVRYPLRRGLCMNPATPIRVALGLLPHLRKVDLKAVATQMQLSAPVRRRARLLLGEGTG